MKIFNRIIAVLGILVAAVALWSKYAGYEANGNIDEGNLKLKEGNTHVLAALEKLKAVEAAAFPQEAEAVRKLANEGAELYSLSGTCFRDAAAKFQTASETVLNNTQKEYFRLEQKSTAKLAELQDALREYLLIYADAAITDANTLKEKVSAPLDRISTLVEEHDKLSAAANQYAAEHKNKIKKAK
jgi:ElaB/YqjD/DUF883 family membrane-anchored ribosome-binding protein